MAIDTIKATAILDGAVDTADLADGAVTTAKITDGNVTVAKMASTLDLSGKTVTYGLTDSDMPAGSIIQVKSATTTGNLGTGTQDLISVSITPTSNTNKILVIGSGLAYAPSGAIATVDIYRDSTFIFRTAGGVGWGVNANNESFTPTLLDDPQTTSAITYKMQGLQVSGSGIAWGYYDSSNTGSTSITVMEVVV